ncbi:hypothetical protein CSB09_03485 [Candidatus Gracilibacteria bacterium]|nr:MAG: hypothetical protein CSB09_03485 [Candidatus Gracilibacteria bacterium]
MTETAGTTETIGTWIPHQVRDDRRFSHCEDFEKIRGNLGDERKEEIAALRFTALAMTGTKSPCPYGHPPLQRGLQKNPPARLTRLPPLQRGLTKKSLPSNFYLLDSNFYLLKSK